MLRRVAISFIQQFFHSLVRVQIRSDVKNTNFVRYIFFDIDNTIADSWPSLQLTHWVSYSQRISSLAVFLNMRRVLMTLYSNPNNRIFFITARSYNSWFATVNWLRANGIPADLSRTIITNTAPEKLQLLTSLTGKTKFIYWIDDLSYNHEFGDVKYYEDLLTKVQSTSIRFFGPNIINQINHI